MELRPYQNELVEKLREGYRAGVRRQLAVSPTGSGKTVTFAFITRSMHAAGKRVVIVVHRREIIEQISAALKAFNVPHGFIQAGRPQVNQPVMVASVQTLGNRLDVTPVPDLVIADECHHIISATYTKVLSAWSSAKLLGVTATPERLDGRGLGSVVDAMVLGPSVAWLIEHGHLAKPVYYAPKTAVDLSSVHKVAGEFDRSESEDIIDTPKITGDAVDHYRRLCRGERAVVFCISVAHAQHVAERFSAAGIPAASIDGAMDPQERRRRLDALRAGTVPVLTSCELVSEGFDLPSVGAAILLRPTASLALHLQQIGRALRPKPGKNEAVILDHVGNCLRHGLAEQEREWSLEGRKKREAKEKLAGPRTCESCYAIYVGPRCPQCQAEAPVKPREAEEVGGELERLTFEEIKLRHAKRREEAGCVTLADWQALAKERGFNPGWAWHRFQARQPRRKNPIARAFAGVCRGCFDGIGRLGAFTCRDCGASFHDPFKPQAQPSLIET